MDIKFDVYQTGVIVDLGNDLQEQTYRPVVIDINGSLVWIGDSYHDILAAINKAKLYYNENFPKPNENLFQTALRNLILQVENAGNLDAAKRGEALFQARELLARVRR